MSNTDRQPDQTDSDQPAAATDKTTSTRTRTRSRDRGTPADAGRDERSQDQPEDRSEGASGDDGGGSRRRRRGGRGRGRGRGGRSGGDGQGRGDGASGDEAHGAAQGRADKGDEGKADSGKGDANKGDANKGGSGKGGSGKGGSGRGGSGRGGSNKGGSGKGSSGKGQGGGKGAGSSGDDERSGDVEDAIAKGGTRIAAKRGGSGGSGGGGAGGGRRKPQRVGGVSEEVRRAVLDGPPRTMLVTAGEDRTQIAVLEDRTVVEHYVTRKEDVTYVGNIYMARVQNVLPGMEAAFLDIGKGRNGVLYAGEVLFDELDLEEGKDERIENVLKPGQKVLVQVTKDPMGSKGPRLTMHLSLAGRYMVLAPDSDLFGISRKLTDKERDRLRRIVKQVKPDHHGVIVRTAAEGATEEQITADIQRLLTKWERVTQAAEEAKALTSVYEEPKLVVKVIRDNFGPEFERCVVDDQDLYHQVREYLEEVAPELLDKVELYGQPTADARSRAAGAPAIESADAAPEDPPATAGNGEEPRPGAGLKPAELQAAAERRQELPSLFAAYDVADQLRKAMSRKVWLPSGGYLIIETTEAMKVIDVNTGKFTGGADTNLEEIVLKTNLEAADEIVRQLRLRDMGGIIVIDFIDMLLKANQEQVVRRLKRELLRDRTKTRVSDVSRLGLVQMTRKNVSQGLIESFSHSCEACEGRGIVSEFD